LTLGAAEVVRPELSPKGTGEHEITYNQTIIGLCAILLSSFLSGFCGVYFEKLLKHSELGIIPRNLQLALYSLTSGLLVYWQTGGESKTFFNGYSSLMWVNICFCALGGLLVAACLKYADNILKNFATTGGIIFVTAVSHLRSGMPLALESTLGTTMVICSMFLYSHLCTKENLAPICKVKEWPCFQQENVYGCIKMARTVGKLGD